MNHIVDQLAQTIREAGARKQPLRIRGGGTKDFYGGELRGVVLDTHSYCGIVDYDPTELVLTARCGTPLAEIEALLRSRGQMLGFEPPHFGEGATLGGCIAAGLSGPRRPYAGAARDLVLGIRLLDGTGADLRFGGQVMKNVAGYDISRLMVGALGTLGVLLEVSLKALPLPPSEMTLRMDMTQPEAIRSINLWAGKPLPITAICHANEQLFVRLSGALPAVEAARTKLGGEKVDGGDRFWQQVRDHRLEFFSSAVSLWRLSVKPTAPPLQIPGSQLIEWNGALRWIVSDAEASAVRESAAAAGGHATLFRSSASRSSVFHPLAPALYQLHERLKATFDPKGILNVGRLYAGL